MCQVINIHTIIISKTYFCVDRAFASQECKNIFLASNFLGDHS